MRFVRFQWMLIEKLRTIQTMDCLVSPLKLSLVILRILAMISILIPITHMIGPEPFADPKVYLGVGSFPVEWIEADSEAGLTNCCLSWWIVTISLWLSLSLGDLVADFTCMLSLFFWGSCCWWRYMLWFACAAGSSFFLRRFVRWKYVENLFWLGEKTVGIAEITPASLVVHHVYFEFVVASRCQFVASPVCMLGCLVNYGEHCVM